MKKEIKMKKNKRNLSTICDELFYKEESNLKGNVGIKNLANTLALDDKAFDEYIDNL